MRSALRPNLFIVGAPKSGTTALYSYLKRHPQILMSKIKEPQFFASDVCGDQRCIRTMSEYLNCFDSPNEDCVVIGEASTCYLGSERAPLEIHNFCPGARVIVMLRNPIDVMYAEHSERIFGGTEHITDFEVALDSPEPRTWRSGPFKGHLVRNLGYREITAFSEQVQRYLRVFGEESVHIIIYDDFALHPDLAYQSVVSFLGVVPHWDGDFNVVNANRLVRSTAVHDLLRHPPAPAKQFARALLSQSMRRTLGDCLRWLNIKQAARPLLDDKFRKRIAMEYAPEVSQLSRVLDRDLLSIWIGPLT
jgi:Sulfotransferase domain